MDIVIKYPNFNLKNEKKNETFKVKPEKDESATDHNEDGSAGKNKSKKKFFFSNLKKLRHEVSKNIMSKIQK